MMKILSVVLVVIYLISAAATISLKVGVITPPDGVLGYGRVVAATTMAVKQVKEDGYLKDCDVT